MSVAFAKLTLATRGTLRAADTSAGPEKVVRLYDGPAPGSENWTQTEQENKTNFWQTRVVFNVASPTLTVFAADLADANGTAVIICVDLYRDWTAAGKPAELHVFTKGGHGFGMRKQNLPTDHWIDRFTDWLDMQGWLKR